jgi:hypothetical protein
MAVFIIRGGIFIAVRCRVGTSAHPTIGHDQLCGGLMGARGHKQVPTIEVHMLGAYYENTSWAGYQARRASCTHVPG